MGSLFEKESIRKEDEEEALEKEFKQLKECPELPINNCEYVNNDKRHWKIVFEGSKYSPYEDGFFTLELLFNKGTFPKCGPEAKFITKMFHPNIDTDGHVCINHLNSWEPTISITSVIFGILEILDNPIASGGYFNEARKLLEKDEEQYFKKVEEYTLTYAKKPININ
jgi:ubiquitin-conjugating enzyme E2 D/E